MVAKPPSAAATRHYRVLPGAPSSGAAWLVSDEPGAPMRSVRSEGATPSFARRSESRARMIDSSRCTRASRAWPAVLRISASSWSSLSLNLNHFQMNTSATGKPKTARIATIGMNICIISAFMVRNLRTSAELFSRAGSERLRKRARPRVHGPGGAPSTSASRLDLVRRDRRGRGVDGRLGGRGRRRGVRAGLALLERIGAVLQPLPALLAPFALPLHALALALQPFAAALLPVRAALERVGRLHVALGAQVPGALILGLRLLDQLLAAQMSSFLHPWK